METDRVDTEPHLGPDLVAGSKRLVDDQSKPADLDLVPPSAAQEAGRSDGRSHAAAVRRARKAHGAGPDEDRDPLWVRGPFLTYDGEHDDGIIVVHGHTPRSEAELLGNRIGIDTGAYFSGRLTCVQLQGERMRLIQVSDH